MKNLLIFLGGAAVGAAATALFTTEKGEDLRERFRALLVRQGILQPNEIDEFVELISEEINNG